MRFPILLLLLAGCSSEPQPAPDFDPERFVGKPNCEDRTFEGSVFTVCKYDAARDSIELAWKHPDGQPLRSLAALEAALGPRAGQVRFAMNAGMYDEDGAPIGLFIEGGEQRKKINRREGAGNFHLLPNGVFSVNRDGSVAVTPSSDFKADGVAWATQSGPMLVIGGKLHPKFEENGPSQLVRNGVGVGDPNTAYFVISEMGVSFGRFARFFRDALGCRNALYLDGTVSSLWDPGAARQDAYSRLGPMVVVFRKSR